MAAEIRILSTDGKLYKSELWDNSKISQGIAVFDLERNHQFVIGLDSYNCYFCSDSHALKIENAGDWYYEDDDFKDKLDGFNATNSLLRTYTETSDLYVLTYCKALNAYLGTFGEHKIVYENISKIKEAFAVLGKSFNYVEQSTPYIHHVYVDEDPVIGETIEFELVQVSYDDDIWNDNLYGGQFYRNDYYLFYKYDGSLEENDVKPKTISENLQIIADSTAAIKQAIIDKGGSIDGDITTWADAISGISGGGSDNLKILSFGSTGSRVYIDGMIWGEWIDSIYNTRDQYGAFYKVSDTGPIYCSFGEVYRDNGAIQVFASQLISDSIIYVISQQSGGA